MARLARVVVPGMPHHVTQRGNRRMQTFFGDEDYRAYLSLLVDWCGRCDVRVWAYCLMPNHIHLIVVPGGTDGLARGLGETHRRYTRRVNFREGWRGYLWQGRFASFVMDEPYVLAATAYLERNPVKAGLEFWGHNTQLLTGPVLAGSVWAWQGWPEWWFPGCRTM